MSGLDGKGSNFPHGIAVAGVAVALTALEGSATIDPASIAAGAQASATITVTGAALGNIVLLQPPYDLQGVAASAYVSAANTVTILLKNGTGGAVDLASGIWKALVLKR